MSNESVRHLRRLAERFFGHVFVERVLTPALADIVFERRRARSALSRHLAAVRGWWGIIKAICWYGILVTTTDARILTRDVAVRFAFACCIGALVLTIWIVPVSNQAFRVAIYNAMRPAGSAVVTLPKGNNERTWSELSALAAQRGSDAAERAPSATRMRLALSVAPLIAALIAISFGVHLLRMFRVLRNP